MFESRKYSYSGDDTIKKKKKNPAAIMSQMFLFSSCVRQESFNVFDVEGCE